MTKQQAKKLAYQIAYAAVSQAIDVGSAFDVTEDDTDAGKVEDALKEISDSLYKRTGIDEAQYS